MNLKVKVKVENIIKVQYLNELLLCSAVVECSRECSGEFSYISAIICTLQEVEGCSI